MNRRGFLRSVGLAGTASVAGCLDSRAAGDDYDVGMSTVAFKPETVTVTVGDAVVWRNTSKQAHTVTAYEQALPAGAAYFASGEFDTESAARQAWADGFGGRIEQQQTYRHTFDVTGEYPYFCVPHEQAGMVGTVVVESE
jgi:plastocyanin